MVKFLNTTPLPLRIWGGSIPLKLLIIKFSNTTPMPLTIFCGGGLKTETGNNIWGLKTETGNFGGRGLKTETGNNIWGRV